MEGCKTTVMSASPSLLRLRIDLNDLKVKVGEDAIFTVEASDAASYQWQMAAGLGANFVNLPGETGASLRIANAANYISGYRFRVVVTGTSGLTTTSNEAVLSVVVPTQLVRSPLDVITVEGETAVFEGEARGSNVQYRWKRSADGVQFDYAGITSRALTITNVSTSMNEKWFLVEVEGDDREVKTSEPAKLTVYPYSSFNPDDSVTADMGERAVIANLPTIPGMNYQWQVNQGTGFTNLEGKNESSLILDELTPQMDGYQYRLVVTGAMMYTSSVATLHVIIPTRIIAQPNEVVTFAGQDASFHVEALGNNLTYQWYVETSGDGAACTWNWMAKSPLLSSCTKSIRR